jgi:hypothetical protein
MTEVIFALTKWVCLQTKVNETRLGRSEQVIPKILSATKPTERPPIGSVLPMTQTDTFKTTDSAQASVPFPFCPRFIPLILSSSLSFFYLQFCIPPFSQICSLFSILFQFLSCLYYSFCFLCSLQVLSFLKFAFKFPPIRGSFRLVFFVFLLIDFL